MPPTPEEVRDFANDTRPDAYAAARGRGAGESRATANAGRGTGWMWCVMRTRTASKRTASGKTAYHYRDYVIDVVQRGQTVRSVHQGADRRRCAGRGCGDRISRGGPYDIVKSPDINLTLMQRQDELADMVNTTGTAFLGPDDGLRALPQSQVRSHPAEGLLRHAGGLRGGESRRASAARRRRIETVAKELAALKAGEIAKNAELEDVPRKGRRRRRWRSRSAAPAGQCAAQRGRRSRAVEAMSVKFTILAASSCGAVHR